jgi:competence protein ComEA
VLLLLGLAIAGHGVRHLLTLPDEAPGGVTLLGEGPPASPAAHRDSVARRARPLAEGERIDVDRAPASQLERLPGVGPGLARRMVADRETKGPFGGLKGLDRVPGVGPALLARVEPWVRFSLSPTAVPAGARATLPTNLNSATSEVLEALPGIGPARARAIVAYREANGPFASLEGLLSVPGVGPSILLQLKEIAEAR